VDEQRHESSLTNEVFTTVVAETVATLPEPFRTLSGDVPIQLLDWPQDEILDHFGITDRLGLLGLYHGRSLAEKSVLDSGTTPDLVFLYREPILAYARDEGETVEDVIRHVVIHELGHHFGLSDADMERIEAEDRETEGKAP